MSEQKEKTALELVDEIIACPGCPSIKHLTCLKSAIERERDANEITIDGLEELVKSNTHTIQEMNDRLKSAITMRPISELPDKVPDGCAVVAANEKHFWIWFKNDIPVEWAKKQGGGKPTEYCVIPAPKPVRRLHPCYMPGCGGEAKIEKTFTGRQYVYCEQCGAHSPVCATMQEAKDAWGYE